VQRYEYSAYGEIVTQEGGLSNPFTYISREYDPESGLYYYRARYYDAEVGRFLQTDPIGFAGGDANLYAYVGNNPVNWIDPLGLLTFQLFGQTINIGVSVSFLPINIAWTEGRFSLSNLSFNAIILPLSAGGGFDISVNPPSPCEGYVSPYLGLGKNLSIGTNVSVVSKGKEPLKLRVQGFNLSIGPSLGIPIGVLVPNAFSNKERQLGDMGIKSN
jgi:RHS repeat-associated protein